MLDGGVRDVLVVIIGLGWLASIIANAVNPAYEPDPSINAAFALVIGAVIGVGKKDNGKDDRRKDR